MAISISNLLNKLTADYETTKGQRQKRYGEGLSELGKVTGLFGPGYGAGMEHAAMTGAKQSLIGRGLGGTTRPMAVGAGMKAGFEDLRRGKMAEALTRMAEYRRMFPEGTATAGVLSHLATGGFGSLLQRDIAEAPGGPLGPTQISSGGTFYDRNISGGRISPFGGSGTGGGGAGGGGGVGSPNFSLPGDGGGGDDGGWSGGGASKTVHFGPPHQATPGYGLGEELNPYSSSVVIGKGPGGGYIYGQRGGGNV